MKGNLFFLPVLLFFCLKSFSQEQDSIALSKRVEIPVANLEPKEPYDPLAPSRAAFYSAVIPGLGQVYNKKYWKVPIVYAGIGTSIYFHTTSRKEYNRFRDAYKRRLAGFNDDEFQGIESATLIRAQRRSRRNMDVSLAFAVGFYLINIVDANVDAHLKQYNISEDLSLSPTFDYNPYQTSTNYGFSLTYKMK